MPGTNINDNKSIPYNIENEILLKNIEYEKVSDRVLPFVCVHPRINISEQLEAIVRLFKINKIY